MNTNKYNLPFYIYKINNRRVQKVRFKDIILDKEIPNSYEKIIINKLKIICKKGLFKSLFSCHL